MDGNSIVIPLIFTSVMTFPLPFLYNSKTLQTISELIHCIFAGGLLLFPIYYSYVIFGWYFLILPGWLLVTFIFWCIAKKLILSGKSLNKIIITRKIIFICLLVMIIIFVFPGLLSTLDIKRRNICDERITGIISSFFWVMIIGIQIYENMRRVYLFKNYYKPYYFLFLRRFIKDEQPQVKNCLNALSQNKAGYDIMKIGNPFTLFSHSDMYDTIYLTSPNWKYLLKSYIRCAKLVFTVIDTSEGVIWEMIENTEYLNKYIYCMLDLKIVDEVKKKLNEHSSIDSVLNHKFQLFLGTIQKRGKKGIVFFSFENHKVVFSEDIDAIIDYKLTSKWNNNLQEMKA
mgnify:FL=1